MSTQLQAGLTVGSSAYLRPSSTNAEALATAGAERLVLRKLRFVNDTGTNRTVTVEHYRAASASSVPLFGAAIAVNANTEVTKEDIDGLLMEEGDEIRVTVSAADSIRCWAYIARRDVGGE